MEDQSGGEDPEEVDKHVIALLATLHYDHTLTVQKWDLAKFDFVLKHNLHILNLKISNYLQKKFYLRIESNQNIRNDE